MSIQQFSLIIDIFTILMCCGPSDVKKIDKKMVLMEDLSILFENLMLDSLVDGFS
jgi:hypothetical protein